MTSHICNRITANNMNENEPLKKVEVKMLKGPKLQRLALGEIGNRASTLRAASIAQKFGVDKPIKEFKKKDIVIKVSEDVAPLAKIVESLPPANEQMEVDEDQVEDLSQAFSSQLLSVEDIDSADHGNQFLISEYVNSIYKYLWELEDAYPVKARYLEGEVITGRMRCILIDWLVQVHHKFSLLQETLYLTVSIIDRYLQTRRGTVKSELQLVGVTAMLIASKYEEIYCPEVGDFAHITDKAYSTRQILKMEVLILNTLKFNVSNPLPLHFLRRNSKAGHVNSTEHNLAKYFMELTLPEYSFCHYKASEIAAASLYLSVRLLDSESSWTPSLCFYSHYSENHIFPIVYKLAALVIKAKTSKHQAINQKYKSSKQLKIVDIPELKSNSPVLRSLAMKATT